jgi:hypothetical protein
MQFSQSRDLKMIDVSKLQTDWTCPKVDALGRQCSMRSGFYILTFYLK